MRRHQRFDACAGAVKFGEMPHRAVSPTLSEQGFDISNTLVPEDDQNPTLASFAAAAPVSDGITKASALNGEGEDSDDDEAFIAAQQAAVNRKTPTGKSSKKGGGFQSMGLNASLLKAITRKGFSVPTPIQRKAVPPILDNQDVVGMARTGSGKTAAFVIPMIEKLKTHSAKVGARAIILSPSRELALQTLKATKELGRGTDLRSILLVGGDSIDDQFSQMSSNPDIIIATPGRFLHLQVEMSLDLSSVRYMVFDEADRLFEMGFATQLTEILAALPLSRQTLLFSATLPMTLVEFAKAGLREPNLIRLDAESKISPDLQSAFFTVKSAEKEAALLHILHDVIKMPNVQAIEAAKGEAGEKRGKKRKREMASGASELPTEHSTVVFAATKHHVEYLAHLLKSSDFAVSYVYSSLDQRARESQVASFRSGESTVLVCTDVAARGVDIPLLANVINYDFPTQAKLFVHRVGRTARAGRKGWSYSLVQTSDVPYLLDLQLFLGRKLIIGRNDGASANFTEDIVLGSMPRPMLDVNAESATKTLDEDEDLLNLRIVATKAEKMYKRSRNSASSESAKRSRSVASNQALQEPCLLYDDTEVHKSNTTRDSMLALISGFRPAETVFEIGRRGEAQKTEAGRVSETMRRKKQKMNLKSELQAAADGHTTNQSNQFANDRPDVPESDDEVLPSQDDGLADQSDDGLEITYPEDQIRAEHDSPREAWQDPDVFMSYEPTNFNAAEARGYGVHSGGTQTGDHANFMSEAQGAILDFGNDESKGFAETSKPKMRWDKKNKKYVSSANDTDGSKGARTIRGESGQKIAASFKSGRYEQWRRANKLDRMPRTGDKEAPSQARNATPGKRFQHYAARAPKQPDKYRDDFYKKKKKLEASKAGGAAAPRNGRVKSDLRSAEDIRKQRNQKNKRREKTGRHARRKT